MKYVQIIHGVEDWSYSIYKCEEDDFLELFPNDQDIEFVEDLIKRIGSKKAYELCNKLCKNPVNKEEIKGLHGTLFYAFELKKKYYPTKKELEAVALQSRLIK